MNMLTQKYLKAQNIEETFPKLGNFCLEKGI